MQDEFSRWRNGHSLVLASNKLSSRKVDDLLDLQLLAYLGSDGEIPEVDEIDDWRNTYLSLQASMGCAFTSLNTQSSPSFSNAPLQPLEVLKKGFGNQASGLSQASLSQALASLDSLDQQLLDAWCQDCIASVGNSHQFKAELRLLLPDSLIIGCELWFVSDAPLLFEWPDWRVDRAALRQSSVCTVSYLLDEKVFDTVRNIVEQTLLGKRQQYRMAAGQQRGLGRE